MSGPKTFIVALFVSATAFLWFMFLYAWQEGDHFDPGILILCLLMTGITIKTCLTGK